MSTSCSACSERHFDLAAQAVSGVRSSCASAAPNCRISPIALLEPSQRVVERLRHFVELVANAAHREAPAQIGDVDRRGGVGQPEERREREVSAIHRPTTRATIRPSGSAAQQQIQQPAECARPSDRVTCRPAADSASPGPARPQLFERRRRPYSVCRSTSRAIVHELPELGTRQHDPHRFHRVGLHDQPARDAVVNLVVARRLVRQTPPVRIVCDVDRARADRSSNRR